jgi:hypothetical protein
MKTITKLFVAVAAFAALGNVAVAQQQPYNLDFETTENSGGVWSTAGTETFAVVANPASDAVNTSAKCGTLTIPVGAPAWALGWTAFSNVLPDAATNFIMTNATSTVTLNVRSSVISQWVIKLESPLPQVDGTNPENMEVKVFNTKVDQWETLTFDFTPNGKQQHRIVILPYVDNSTSQVVVSWDDLVFGDGLNRPTSLSNINAEGVSVSPNPTSGLLNISAAQELSQVVVSNILGQAVKTVAVSGLASSVDVSDLAAGTYVVSIKLANGTVATQKVVKK